MFPFRLTYGTAAVLLVSAALALLGFITAGSLVWLYVFAPFVVLGLLMARDPDRIMRRVGSALLASAVLGLGFAFGMHPALAHAATDLVWRGGLASDLLSPISDAAPLILAPAGDTGLWSSLNGYIATGLATIVTAAVSWAATAFAAHTKIKIRADQEASIRETMLTGAYAAMHNLELAIDDHWTPAQRQKVIDNMVVWVEQRAAAQLQKLGLPNFVVNAMAGKVLGQLQGFGIGSDLLDTLMPAAPLNTGNPGETPALDRAAGGNGGA